MRSTLLTTGVVAAIVLAVVAVVATTGARGAPSSATSLSPTPTSGPGPTPDSYVLVSMLPEVNFSRMVGMALIPGLPDEAVVLIQTGKLWRISLSSAFAPYLFGDITSQVTQVSQGGEEGLLGIAFSPQFQTDGRLYLFYNRKPAANNIPCPISEPPGYNIYNYNTLSRFTVSGNVLNPASEEQLISLADCFGWHNGGQLFFGPDGYLYLSTGDEGNIHDPHQNGQNLDVLFAKLLRLDVSGASGYTSPPDNPFVGVAGRDEIWAWGFRNPWRFSFDPVTDDIWLGDVGPWNWEEVNHIVEGGNYGWSVMEGFVCYGKADPNDCDQTGKILPREVYSNLDVPECALIGGFPYRGSVFPELQGWYTYADYCTGQVWALDTTGPSCPPAASGCHGIRLASCVAITTGCRRPLITSWGRLPNGELIVFTFSNGLNRLARDTDSDDVPDDTDPCPSNADCDGDSLGLTATQTGSNCPVGGARPRFNDCMELFLGTNPTDACADTLTPNDEATDKMPADFNDDRFVDVTDRTLMALAIKGYLANPANYSARYDLNATSSLNVTDRTIVVLYMNQTGGLACTP